jgi:hypothetical protein
MVRALAAVCTAALVACSRQRLPPAPTVTSPIVIRDPCNDFVTQFAPDPSPKLVHRDGQLLLEVPFTPAAGYEEVEQMDEAVKHGPCVARVEHTGREFIIQSRAPGGIMVYVESLEHAEAILRDLCYHGDKAKLAAP